jgi:hypothetical protein
VINVLVSLKDEHEDYIPWSVFLEQLEAANTGATYKRPEINIILQKLMDDSKLQLFDDENIYW